MPRTHIYTVLHQDVRPFVLHTCVQTRVSGVMTNAPFMLNVDCDMFANNPKVILHAMCLLLGFDDEVHSGFVQAPQKFYNALEDDPFGNQLEVMLKVRINGVLPNLTVSVAENFLAVLVWVQKVGFGISGLQGMFYGGTGCFHRRKVFYGTTPPGPIRDVEQPSKIKGKLL
jgi:hypothetical protein